MTNDRPASETWAIASQQETTAQDETGRYVPGVRVAFRTASGLNGTVFVPDARYNADSVYQAIAARVAQMVAVQNLEG